MSGFLTRGGDTQRKPTVPSVGVFLYWGLLAVPYPHPAEACLRAFALLFPRSGTLFLLDLPAAPYLAFFKSSFLREASLRPTF